MNANKLSPVCIPGINVLILVLFIFMLLFPFPTLAQNQQDLSQKRLVFATELLYPPYSFLNNNGYPSGFNVDLTKAIADIAGLNIEIIIGPWGEIRNALKAKELDAIVGMYYSQERDKSVDFTSAFTIVEHSVFARKGSSGFTSLDDIRNKGIIVMRGDIMHDYVLEEGLTKTPVLTDTTPEALRLLSTGEYDYAMVAKAPGLYWIRELKLTNIHTIGDPLFSSKYCYAVSEGNIDLQRKLNEGLALLKETGRYDQIYNKWLGTLESQGTSKSTIFINILLVLVPIFLLIAFRSKLGWKKE